MQTQAMSGILLIAVELLSNAPGGFCDEKRPVPNLVGDYRLVLPDAAEPKTAVGNMTVFAQNGNKFLIGISERSTNPAENWRGQGILIGNKGHYDWRFSDGKKGRTIFTLESDGSLRGHVKGAGINWHYLAEKQPEETGEPPHIVGEK